MHIPRNLAHGHAAGLEVVKHGSLHHRIAVPNASPLDHEVRDARDFGRRIVAQAEIELATIRDQFERTLPIKRQGLIVRTDTVDRLIARHGADRAGQDSSGINRRHQPCGPHEQQPCQAPAHAQEHRGVGRIATPLQQQHEQSRDGQKRSDLTQGPGEHGKVLTSIRGCDEPRPKNAGRGQRDGRHDGK
jgi:hypothetical protein